MIQAQGWRGTCPEERGLEQVHVRHVAPVRGCVPVVPAARAAQRLGPRRPLPTEGPGFPRRVRRCCGKRPPNQALLSLAPLPSRWGHRVSSVL